MKHRYPSLKPTWVSLALLASAATGLAVLVSAPVASAKPKYDISGTWKTTGPYSQVNTIVMNARTGKFTGSGYATNGTGYTWPNHGTVVGTKVHWVYGPYRQLKSYTATCDGTVSAGGSKIVGTCTDTVGHRLAWTIARTSKRGKRGKRGSACTVPQLKGDTLAAARLMLKRDHCTLGKVTKRHTKTVPKGRIISTSPKAGTKHRAGTRVNVVVSG